MDRRVDRSLLRISATLLLVWQVLYVLVTLLHTGGEANNHPAGFDERPAQSCLGSRATG